MISGVNKTIDFYVKVPTGASKMTVTYSVDGSTKTNANVTDDGKVQVSAATYTKDVAIKVLNVEVTEYTLKVTGNDAVALGSTKAVAVAGTRVSDATVKGTDGKKATIKFTVKGGTSSLNKADGVYTTEQTSAISSGTATVNFGTITPDKSGEVVITITEVTFAD